MTIETDLHAPQLERVLVSNLRPPPESPFRPPPPSTLPLLGSVTGRTFILGRALEYRNSFAPQARGEIVPLANGARLDITLAMHPFVMVFMSMWLAFPLGVSGLIAFSALTSGGSLRVIVVPMAMFCVGYAICLGAFKHEAPKLRAALLGVTKGREVSR